MKLFSIRSSDALSLKISEHIDIPLSKSNLTVFNDSEIKPTVTEDVRGEDCIIVSSTSNPVNDSYMELFLLVDALKRSAAGRIVVIMPYFGYARQNQQHMPGESVSARVMVKFIQSIGIDELVTLDIHEEQMMGFFDIPAKNISALPLLAKHIANIISSRLPEQSEGSNNDSIDSSDSLQNDNKQIIVISPDQGGVERTRVFRDAFAEALHRHPERGTTEGSRFIIDEEIGIVEKKRNLEGKHETKVIEVTGNIEGKIAVIPDDVIVSGGTISHAADEIRNRGATAVYLCATHANFIEGTVERLKNAPVDKVLVTDTIAIKDEWKFDKLEVVSVSEMIVDEIKKLT